MKSALEALDWPRFTQQLALSGESVLGQRLLRNLQPFATFDALTEAREAVAEAQLLVGTPASPSFRAIDDLTPLLEAARSRAVGLDGKELARALTSLKAGEFVRQRLSGRRDTPRLKTRALALANLSALVASLETTIDAAGSVLDSASPELALVRRERGEQERRVRDLALAIGVRSDWRTLLREGPPVLRDGRFMLAVKADARGHVRGILHDRSASGETVFVEPDELIEPQNRLADLRAKEGRLIDRLLLERTRELLRLEAAVHETQRQLASLDALFARARFGIERGAELIAVASDGALVLTRARQPLLWLDRPADSIVPFDLELGGVFDALVISGPNTGGKTATLKAVGLIVALAHAAVPVPVAFESRIPWFDQVHADVGDEQDLAQNLSTFSGHLRRIAELLGRATKQSLVLLDELGTGTEPKEGEALGRALLLALLERGTRVIATTHLSGLKDLGFEVPRVQNASLEFDGDTLAPTYRLTMGLPGESNALKIARRYGIPAPIVARAEEFLHGVRGSAASRSMEEAARARRAALDHLDAAETRRREAETKQAAIVARAAELEAKARLFESEKEREIDAQLRAAQVRGNAALLELGTLPAAFAPKLAALERFLAELPQRTSLAEKRTAFLGSRKKGDTLFLPRYREHCVVRKVDAAKRLVVVLYRNLPVEVSFDEVQCPDDVSR